MNRNDFDELNNFVKQNYEKNKLRKVKRKKVVIILINFLSISFLIAAGIGLKSIFDYQNDLKEIKQLQTDLETVLKEKPDTSNQIPVVIEELVGTEPLADFDSLLSTNNDTVGWLNVKNTYVNLPIVQGNNNEYYLTHDFNKTLNSLGWAFADYRNNFPNLDRNTILYGHTFKDIVIFSTLKYVLEESWLENDDNLVIEFSTTDYLYKWQIFSIYTTPKTNDYMMVDFTDEEFLSYVDLITSRSIKDFDVDLDVDDKILTLSTCYMSSKNRLVIHAKLIG